MSEPDRSDGVRRPEPPLPEESGLTLDEYLEMQQAIGHKTRFRILRTLVANDELSAADLKAAVDVESHNFHYHLDELVDVGLVDKRQRRTADSRGFYTYYRPTAMGRDILEYGVEELMRREREFNDVYT
ncbi:winged helix-turn-helix domain-containing protein [Halapricum desulfuricans]|uniref:Transcriptional regulator containing HTH domain,ArsR family n=1 Tax=Halapricum desulfuricans TaxID=2841257 RepID=A0A897N198_9EURY|nr:helix-turn-helix domain-containing protein [Halapricum desulfuricans]QSG05083.1 Transcriptional regulator containing HTH domain,ArsR family [Halapricum desulfuricans]